MAKLVLYAILGVFVSVLLMWLLLHVLSAVYYVGWMLLFFGFMALIGYIAFSIFKPKLPRFAIKRPAQYKLADIHHPHVYAFRNEPSLRDIAMLNDELHIAKLELQGDILSLTNNTVIDIVEDSGKEAIKVKLKDRKAKEKIFWVPRAAVVKMEQPKLLGS